MTDKQQAYDTAHKAYINGLIRLHGKVKPTQSDHAHLQSLRLKLAQLCQPKGQK